MKTHIVGYFLLTLLVLIAVGVFAVRRFNYGVLVACQGELEIQVRSLSERLAKIDRYWGSKETEKSVVLNLLDQVPQFMRSTTSGISTQSELISGLVAEVSALRDWRRAQEAIAGAGSPPTGDGPRGTPAGGVSRRSLPVSQSADRGKHSQNGRAWLV